MSLLINPVEDLSSDNYNSSMTPLFPDEGEKDIFITLSSEIAALHDREDLFELIARKTKDLFCISDFGIVLINQDRKTYSPFMLEGGNPTGEREWFPDSLNSDYSVADPVFSRILASTKPVLFRVKELAKQPGIPCYVTCWDQNGVDPVLGVALRAGGKDLGCVFLHLTTEKPVRERLFNIIFAQFAAGMANLLALEEIAQRERERELLLSFNIEIAATKNRNEFLQVLNRKLKILLGFSHTLIALINADGQTASAYLIDPETAARNHPAFEGAKHGEYPLNDGVLDKVLNSPKPLEFDLSRMAESRQIPFYFRINFESGIKQAVVSRLSKGGEAFGFWMIYFDQKKEMSASKLNLLTSLANQVSIAASNMVSVEEIKRREEEKSKILSFSNAIASVRDKNVLAKILKRQLRELFQIEDYIIYASNENKKTHHPILYDLNAGLANHPDFKKLVHTETEVDDQVFNSVLCSGSPVKFNTDQWVQSIGPSINAEKPVGLKQMSAVPICMGEDRLAVMVFRQHEENQTSIPKNLFRSILSQIAITVANIIANEKVSNQLQQINRYKQQLEEEKIYLKEEIKTTQNYAEIVGNSPEMQSIFQLVKQVAESDSTVLLLGETGTGKELIARAIHNDSPRKDNLMIKVNCAALPANLIESELFGHEKGSFTGAIERRIGKFELANNGTLFLDEIGEMPLELQVKLLRALQEREIERVGGRQPIKVNVRIIAATNRDLEKETREGHFRLDLYYRLNIFPISLPPLRERKQDISALASYFMERFSHKAGKKIAPLTEKVLLQLIQYPWPGNIRELEHLMERSVLLSNGNSLAPVNLPVPKQYAAQVSPEEKVIIKTIDENERDHILGILKYCKGRISGPGGAAELLGIPPSTLNSKVKKLGIRKEHS